MSIEEWVKEAYERNELEVKMPVVNGFVFVDSDRGGRIESTNPVFL